MTKKEAMELEIKCDKLMSEYLNIDCTVGLALTGRFKVIIEDDYIILEKNKKTVSYIKFQGEYSELEEYISSIIKCIEDNKELFDKLIWSYNHMNEINEE